MLRGKNGRFILEIERMTEGTSKTQGIGFETDNGQRIESMPLDEKLCVLPARNVYLHFLHLIGVQFLLYALC